MSGLGLRLTSSSAARCSSAVLRFQLRPRGSRSIHKRKTLPYPIEGGLGNFLPPEALKVVAVDYQEGLLKRLDEEVRGSPEAVEDIAQTVLNTACSKERTLAFNYASLALNNDYFLNQLMPLPTEGSLKNHQNEISAHLATNIREQYGTLIQLKSAFSSAVMGMFTSGSVWFVTDRSGRLGIIPTFGPGTLLFRSRMYMGQPDVRGPSLGQLEPTVPYVHAHIGRPRKARQQPYILVRRLLFPLFCISVNEHAWMAAGYGVWGKEAWLKEFWTVLDWKKVSQAYERISPGIKVSIDKVD
ncbi:Putative 37S ribosomal protein S26A, mitochondrial [Termitomyces sp. J132]|nr:Putative 37S ribosomal protein S26A, mitochondrial [Termitomyces sp. J132]